MRLKPHPDDIRFWPRREGGKGFPRSQSAPSRQYSALRTYDQHRNLMADDSQTNVSIDVTAQPVTRDYTPDTVKSRARAALVLAVSRITDKLNDTANELTLNELSQATSSLGRISGIGDEQRDATVTVVVTRDAPPTNGMLGAVDNLAKDMGHSELPSAPSRIALPSPDVHVLRDVNEANAMRDNALDDASSRDT